MNAVALLLFAVFVVALVLGAGKVAVLAGIILVLWLGYLLWRASDGRP